MSISEKVVRDTSKSPRQYTRRVHMVAAIYVMMNLTALITIVLLVWHYRFWVTVAQRSNVETLTVLIIVMLFSYLILTTFRGVLGAARILFYRLGGDTEARKQAALQPAKPEEHNKAYFNLAVVRQGHPDEPIHIPVGDGAGALGELVIDGVEVIFKAEKHGISNSLFEYVVNQLSECLEAQQSSKDNLNIVQWGSIDDEAAAQYHSQAQAFRTLARQLEKGPIWPTVELTEEDISRITGSLRRLVPALRDEAFLPDVEYQAEYNIPIIPEPLGFIQLKRSEKRADPVSTMGCAAVVTVVTAVLVVVLLIFPPWLPSR